MTITKVCSRCREVKNADCFSKCSKSKTGLTSYCKACQAEYIRQRGSDTPTVTEKSCRACGDVKKAEAFAKNSSSPDGLNARCKSCRNARKRELSGEGKGDKAYRVKMKRDAMDGYGGHCACCGESEISVLVLDHVNNDGAAHRREIATVSKTGVAVYKWAVDNNFPDILQVLCANCNTSKHVNGGVCYHKLPG